MVSTLQYAAVFMDLVMQKVHKKLTYCAGVNSQLMYIYHNFFMIVEKWMNH